MEDLNQLLPLYSSNRRFSITLFTLCLRQADTVIPNSKLVKYISPVSPHPPTPSPNSGRRGAGEGKWVLTQYGKRKSYENVTRGLDKGLGDAGSTW
jgi:hypothetical protein